MTGEELIELCKEHVLQAMQHTTECQPGGTGLGNKDIEREAVLQLGLARQDGWFTWSLLMSLAQDGRVEIVEGPKRGRRFRLLA